MNIREIARIADVTPGTVSKVMNNYPDVGEATRKHVLEIIEEYQYAPKVAPRRKGKAIPKIAISRLTLQAMTRSFPKASKAKFRIADRLTTFCTNLSADFTIQCSILALALFPS